MRESFTITEEWGCYELMGTEKGVWLISHQCSLEKEQPTWWGPGIHKKNGECHNCDAYVPQKVWDAANLLCRGKLRIDGYKNHLLMNGLHPSSDFRKKEIDE